VKLFGEDREAWGGRIEVLLLQNDFTVFPFVVYFLKYWSSIMEK
jgi:hypothetical protein